MNNLVHFGGGYCHINANEKERRKEGGEKKPNGAICLLKTVCAKLCRCVRAELAVSSHLFRALTHLHGVNC